jgi:hypothetical protein
MLNSGDWTAIGTLALAAVTVGLAWVTSKTARDARTHDDEKRTEDRLRDDEKRTEDRLRDDEKRTEDRQRDDEKRTEDRMRDDRLRQEQIAQLERSKQVEAIRILSSRTIINLNIALNVFFSDLLMLNLELNYLLVSVRLEAERLAEQIDIVIGLGLMTDLIRRPGWRGGSDEAEDSPYTEVGFLSTFTADLRYKAYLPPNTPIQDLITVRMIKGLVRLLEVLVDRWPDVIDAEAAERELARGRQLLKAQED